MNAVCTNALGDWLTVEAHLTEEERNNTEKVFIFSKQAPAIKTLIDKCYPHWTPVILRGEKRIYTCFKQCVAEFGQVEGAADWSISTIFPQIRSGQRQYAGSRLINLTDPPSADNIEWLKNCYVVCPASINGVHARQFDFKDWRGCFNVLDRENAHGVVLMDGHYFRVREHPRLVDLSNELDICAALELCRYARGYIGIDSMLSCWFNRCPGKMYVKSVNPQFTEEAKCYLAPRYDPSVVYRSLEGI